VDASPNYALLIPPQKIIGPYNIELSESIQPPMLILNEEQKQLEFNSYCKQSSLSKKEQQPEILSPHRMILIENVEDNPEKIESLKLNIKSSHSSSSQYSHDFEEEDKKEAEPKKATPSFSEEGKAFDSVKRINSSSPRRLSPKPEFRGLELKKLPINSHFQSVKDDRKPN
jgi:hypothetical protein